MPNRWILSVVAAAARWPMLATLVAFLCAAASIWYTTLHFAINTDTDSLLWSDLPWRQREARFDALFPHRANVILIVVDGATPEIAELAAARLAERLNQLPDRLRNVRRPDGGSFFERNGLLFLSVEEVQRTTEQLIAAQPLLGTLAMDPSAHGLLQALSLVLEGVRRGEVAADAVARPVAALADAVEGALAGRYTPFSLRSLIAGDQAANARELRRFILVQPVLDFTALQPGAAATEVIRGAAGALGLDSAHGVRVRLTGEVPLADEELATLADHAALNAGLTLLCVIALLWLAVRSLRIAFAILASLAVGLAITAAFGLMVFGAFNLISIAFAVLFVGLGIDFGIQFSVSCRAHRYTQDDLTAALTRAARQVGRPLALAAASTALGFYAFVPTEYRGVSELGAIAGTGMLIAFVLTITLLPALLRLLDMPAKRAPMGYASLARVDRLLVSHRRNLLIAISGVGLVCALGALQVRFDFNPLHLRSADTESVSTLLDLMRNPETDPNTLNVLVPSIAEAQALASRIDALPEVAQTLTLASFIPEDQERKLALISDAALLLDATINTTSAAPPPEDRALADAMRKTAQQLQSLPVTEGALARNVARLERGLSALAEAPAELRSNLDSAIAPALKLTLAQIRAALSAGPVSLQTLPRELVQDWVGVDGTARIEVHARGDTNDNDVLRRFVAAVKTIAPDATGAPVAIQESSSTIIRAFFTAGVWAWLAITMLLALVLRSVRDVLLTLAPLVLSGLSTLALCALCGIRLNFENVIALPLLLGVGVAFDIYFVMAWRAGARELLQSSLTRAIIFSALTTSAAFGSLWFSRHPGTASMGELLALSLTCTLVCTLLVLPVLLASVASSADRSP
jgi:hopanoid biosynthesis associated RND transporter like protein HpnN